MSEVSNWMVHVRWSVDGTYYFENMTEDDAYEMAERMMNDRDFPDQQSPNTSRARVVVVEEDSLQ